MVLSLGSLFLFCLLCLNAVAILNTRRFLAPCKVPRNFLYQPCARTFMLFSSPPHLISQMDLWLASLPSMSSLSVQLQHKFAVTCLSWFSFVLPFSQVRLHDIEQWAHRLEEECNTFYLVLCIPRLAFPSFALQNKFHLNSISAPCPNAPFFRLVK